MQLSQIKGLLIEKNESFQNVFVHPTGGFSPIRSLGRSANHSSIFQLPFPCALGDKMASYHYQQIFQSGKLLASTEKTCSWFGDDLMSRAALPQAAIRQFFYLGATATSNRLINGPEIVTSPSDEDQPLKSQRFMPPLSVLNRDYMSGAVPLYT